MIPLQPLSSFGVALVLVVFVVGIRPPAASDDVISGFDIVAVVAVIAVVIVVVVAALIVVLVVLVTAPIFVFVILERVANGNRGIIVLYVLHLF